MSIDREGLNKLLILAYQRSAFDKSFRREMLANATAALEHMLGASLPLGLRFKAIESDPAYTLTLVLPDPVSENISLEKLGRVTKSFLETFSIGKRKSCRGSSCDPNQKNKPPAW